MANRTLFKSAPRTTQYGAKLAVNDAGGGAFDPCVEHNLCQFVVTGCFNGTYYASAETQLGRVKEMTTKVSSELLAKAAVYGSVNGMKDMPAYFLAVLAARGETDLVRRVFFKVCHSTKMLCNFVQIMRSGVTGRKSFGSAIRNLIRQWLGSLTPDQLFAASIGQANPSLADIIKMVHVKPEDIGHQGMFRYLLDKETDLTTLPEKVVNFERLKKGEQADVKGIPFRALTNLSLGEKEWKEVALSMPWNTLRMNLNMLNRKGLFADEEFTLEVASRLGDANQVRKWNAFPYQLLTAYQNTTDLPMMVRNALQDAMEVATENVPAIDGKVAICVDVSGSMRTPITGNRDNVSSVTRCVDVAALVAACILRSNPNADLYAFDTRLHQPKLNPRDSVMTNANLLACFGGGGTDCSLPFQYILGRNKKYDAIVFLSDNESWSGPWGANRGAAYHFARYKNLYKDARLVCVDLIPNLTTQVPDSKSCLNIGGWSDSVFDLIASFVNGKSDNFVEIVKSVEI